MKPEEIVCAIPVYKDVVRTQVEVRQIVGDPQQRDVDEAVTEQINGLAVVVFHPAAGSGYRVTLGTQVDTVQGLRKRAVDYEDRFAIIQG